MIEVSSCFYLSLPSRLNVIDCILAFVLDVYLRVLSSSFHSILTIEGFKTTLRQAVRFSGLVEDFPIAGANVILKNSSCNNTALNMS